MEQLHRHSTVIRKLLFLLVFLEFPLALAQTQRVVDVATRSGVTQRFLLLQTENAKATVVLFAGGDGALALSPTGAIRAMNGNFVVRTREQFAAQGLSVAVIDAPSDRTSVGGFRQSADHVTDVKAAITWLKQELKLPVWLVGTSRGTQSVAYIATQLAPADGGPDGIVLTSTMLDDRRGRPVPDMPLERITVPVLVAHHVRDGCIYTRMADMPRLTSKLSSVPKTELLTFEGGVDIGNPCGARGHHGFAGIEREVVDKIAAWIKQHSPAR
jgi:alpha-beta hydrolase superfamily lysophospholipase